MRTRFFATILALVGWALIAPTPWANLAHGQSSITLGANGIGTASGTLSSVLPSNPRNGSGFGAVNGASYTVTLAAGGSYVFDVWGTGPNGADMYMYLYGPAGYITEDDDSYPGNPNIPYNSSYSNGGWNGAPNTTTGSSRIGYTVPAGGAGTYTIYCTIYCTTAIANYGQPNSPPYNVQITTSVAPPAPPAPPVLPSGNILTYDGNADSTTPTNPHANFFGAGSTSTGRAHTVTLAAGGTYVIRTYTGASVGHPSGAYLSDSYIYVVNPGGAVVAQTSGDAGGGSTVTYTAGASGSYTIWVCNYQQVPWAGTIFYHLTVDGPPPIGPGGGGSGIPNVKLAPSPLNLDARPSFAFNLNLGRLVDQPAISTPTDRCWISSAIRNCRIA